MSRKIVIIGVDGAPYELIKDLSNRGVMPNTKKIIELGEFKKLKSSIPHVSSVAWSSIITGKNPGEHGIFGFVEISPNNYEFEFPNFRNLKKPPFWKSKGKCVIINVPSTYPASEINGFLVSGFVSLNLEKSVYPKEYLQMLKDIDYKIDVDSSKAHTSKEVFLDDLFETLDKRNTLWRKVWDSIEWDVFMLIFTGSDRLMHFLWGAYEDENHKYHKQFLEFFRLVDESIGEITQKAGETPIILLSDHGMERVKTNVFINEVLRREGLLFNGFNEKEGYQNILKGTKAFCLDPGRIYLHKKDKYPRGDVEKAEEEKIINKLIDLLESLEYNGEKVIKEVYRKKEIYHGGELENAPDLVLLENLGFRLRGNLFKDEIFSQDVFTGKHTQENAFIIVKNDEKILPDKPTVEDISKLIDKLF